MQVTQKHSPTYVISLTEKEAVMLAKYLFSSIIPSVKADHEALNEFSVDLCNEINGLLFDDPVQRGCCGT